MDVQAGDAGMDNMQFIVNHNDPSIDIVKNGDGVNGRAAKLTVS